MPTASGAMLARVRDALYENSVHGTSRLGVMESSVSPISPGQWATSGKITVNATIFSVNPGKRVYACIMTEF